jgi:hypothetical protein
MALLAFALGACGSEAVPAKLIASVVFDNQSRFDLDELRIHRMADYSSAPNLLKTAMLDMSQVVFYGDGAYYVTVLREKYHLGPILAFTTATPMTMERDKGYRLVILQDSFRLEMAERENPRTTKLAIIGDPPPDLTMTSSTSTTTRSSTESMSMH